MALRNCRAVRDVDAFEQATAHQFARRKAEQWQRIVAGVDDRAIAVLAQHKVAYRLGERLVAQRLAAFAIHGDRADVRHGPAERTGVERSCPQAVAASACSARPVPTLLRKAIRHARRPRRPASEIAASAQRRVPGAGGTWPREPRARRRRQRRARRSPGRRRRARRQKATRHKRRSSARRRARRRARAQTTAKRREKAPSKSKALPDGRRGDGQQPDRRGDHENCREPETNRNEGLEPRAFDGACRRLSNREIRDTLLDDGTELTPTLSPLGQDWRPCSPQPAMLQSGLK